MAHPHIGVWLIGARGGVATTTIVGLIALENEWIDGTGLVSQLPQFQHLDLPAWDSFLVGGHEIRGAPLAGEAARLLPQMRVADADLARRCRAELERIDGRIRPGTLRGVGPTIAKLADLDFFRQAEGESPRQAVARLQGDMSQFARENNLEHVVVVNLASTEPVADAGALPSRWAELEPLLSASSCPLPASSLYAIAALGLGYSYVNFTPSLGASPPAIDELARLRGGRHAGCDGKTGETLLKSVLAPLLAQRNLRVLSWVGHNIFGNLDGQVLDDPANKQTKIKSKDHLLGEILGYRPQTLVSIEYVQSLGEWKTAWDHVHFAGFLGTPMTLQFTWQGCDSVLAAPLVLDLVRWVELARRRGHTGLLGFLASYFKSPLGVDEHRFDRQFQMLERWAG
jgi:myo-inositol-1-phosphate synthase